MYKLSKPGKEVDLGLSPHYEKSAASILGQPLETMRSDETNTVLRPSAKGFGENGVNITMTGRAEGNPISIEIISIVAPGGVGPSYAATVFNGNVKDYLPLLEHMANSTKSVAVKESGKTSTWRNKVSEKGTFVPENRRWGQHKNQAFAI